MSKRSTKTSKQAKTKRVARAFDIPVELHDRLLEFCAATGFDLDAVINAAMRKYLARVEAAEAAEKADEKSRVRVHRSPTPTRELPL
jgi:hypothetical protein